MRMQLGKLSVVASILIVAMNASAEDYINVEFLQYDESDSRTSVSAPSIEINKDFGADYTLNVDIVADAVSGASPSFYDADSSSGASAHSRGSSSNIEYGNIEYDENRLAGAARLTTRFANRDELGVGVSYSTESDFYSFEGSLSYLHYLDDSHNQSLSLAASFQSNEVLIKECTLNNSCADASSGASEKMTNDAMSVQLAYSQVLDETSVANIGLFYTSESGYLSSPYHNIVRNGNFVEAEKKPEDRAGYGLKLSYQKALSDSLYTQLSYKYYSDDWGIDSHTVDTHLYYEIGDDWRLGAGLRYYIQSEADFYAENFTTQEFASSDFRVSDFDAITYKATLDYEITKDLSYNLGANFYDQSTGLSATFFTTGIKYKF